MILETVGVLGPGLHLLYFLLTIYLAQGLSAPHGSYNIYLVTLAKRSGYS